LSLESTADALERALEMSPERRRELSRKLCEQAAARRPDDWIQAQIDDLQAIQAGEEPLTAPCAS
jgi:trehalose-6-phosphate synthase